MQDLVGVNIVQPIEQLLHYLRIKEKVHGFSSLKNCLNLLLWKEGILTLKIITHECLPIWKESSNTVTLKGISESILLGSKVKYEIILLEAPNSSKLQQESDYLSIGMQLCPEESITLTSYISSS